MDMKEFIAIRNKIEQESIMSMATLRKIETGLPVNIWVDDGMEYKGSGHGKRIKFQPDKGDRPVTRNFATMKLSDTKVVGEHELSSKEIQQLKDFVIRNREALELVSEMEISIGEFLKRMVK
jgi:hypothetical protein